jgi:hypothetical protein
MLLLENIHNKARTTQIMYIFIDMVLPGYMFV